MNLRKLLGDYRGDEIVTGDMISRPIEENRYFMIYRAENHEKALEIFELWKKESLLEANNE